MVQEFTRDQVASHSSKDDLYLIVRNKVYNASEFVAEHPGGEEVLLEIAGRDATEAYEDAGHSEEADEILVDLFVGELSANLDVGNPEPVVEPSKPITGYNKQDLTISKPRKEATDSAPNSLSSFLVHESFQETELVEKTYISHNVVICRFKLPQSNQTLGLPIGQHLSIGAILTQPDGNTKEFIRSYTPISKSHEAGYFEILVKSYPKGNVSKHIASLELGDKIRVRGPKGAFLYTPNMVRHIGMVAGGSGITPMLQVIQAVLGGRSSGDTTEIDFIFANVGLEDILLKERLDALAEMDQGFRVHYVLEKPPSQWKGRVGYVTADMISELLPKPAQHVKILVCGPPPMVRSLKISLEDLGFERPLAADNPGNQVFVF
ncbi:unnamed protein product [Clonostachys chloroleuca]|uniref:NADH-cytochrome b5 reductase 1 n=1 Tax=Clonostachys chloroleuca TaxID=1926264 RepID=A0AA35MDK7_9HYPO|nr:unnamed protein product [Clonostachys chloroleuca]